MIGITPRQHKLLTYIYGCEICPTFEEMRVAIGAESCASVTRALNGLEERGHIRRLHRRVRAIEVLAPPKPATIRLRPVPISNVPPHPIAGQGPTPFWDYPDHSARTCADWTEAEAA